MNNERLLKVRPIFYIIYDIERTFNLIVIYIIYIFNAYSHYPLMYFPLQFPSTYFVIMIKRRPQFFNIRLD